MTKRRQHQGEKQQGAILFISLIILLLMTIVAVGSVQLSTMGQRISMTYQLQNTSFQVAESALNKTQRLLERSPFALNQANNGTLRETYKYTPAGLKVTATTTTQLRERVLDSGNSLGVGKSLPQIFIYETRSTTQIDGYDISTELEQGYQARILE